MCFVSAEFLTYLGEGEGASEEEITILANRWETVADFIFLGSKITADGDCSHEIKRCLLLGRKGMTNLYRILRSRDITFYKGPCSQGYGFSNGHIWM